MSTWIYLVCDAHDEPERAEDESGQHLYDLPQLRLDWAHRRHWLTYLERFPDCLNDGHHLARFSRNTYYFLREHRECGVTPRVESSYGDEYALEVGDLGALFDETPTRKRIATGVRTDLSELIALALYGRSNPSEGRLHYTDDDYEEGERIVDRWLRHA